MKLTVTKTETQEIDITFPVYKTHSGNYYKGISENEWIQLMPVISGIYIASAPYRLDDIITKGKDVSEDAFNEKFIEVFNKIKSYKPQYSVI
jgi:disulfide oxidoreductase YuzD